MRPNLYSWLDLNLRPPGWEARIPTTRPTTLGTYMSFSTFDIMSPKRLFARGNYSTVLMHIFQCIETELWHGFKMSMCHTENFVVTSLTPTVTSREVYIIESIDRWGERGQSGLQTVTCCPTGSCTLTRLSLQLTVHANSTHRCRHQSFGATYCLHLQGRIVYGRWVYVYIVTYRLIAKRWLCKQRPLLGNARNNRRTVLYVVSAAAISGHRLSKHVPASTDTNVIIEERCFPRDPCRDIISKGRGYFRGVLHGRLWRENSSAWSWRISTVRSRCQGTTGEDTEGWKMRRGCSVDLWIVEISDNAVIACSPESCV
jgi:hypothetical protein